MSKSSSRRHRDRAPPLNADYYGGADLGDDPRYYGSQSPPRSRRYEEPPRRGKSERRRAVSPYEIEDPQGRPMRRSSRKKDHAYEKPPKVVNGGRRPPTPPYAEPTREKSHRDRDRDGKHRSSKRSSMPPPPPIGHPDSYAAAMDARSGRPPKGYRDEPDPYSPRRRSRHSPPPEPRRRRDSMEPRPRGRDYPPPPHPDDRYGPPPSRHRSQARDMSPRGRPPPATAGRPRGGPPPPRRNSMPASTRRGGGAAAAAAAGAAGAAASSPWWKNPMVQNGARQAFTAGAQAAIRSKDDKGPWMGPKGAKIATAALSAALVDGFLGQKKPDAPEREFLRTGGDAAMNEIDRRRR